MCGLAGVARLGGHQIGAEDVAVLRAMTRALAHRGPDEEKHLHEDGPVGLSFTRLSLVDPVGGGQPLSTDDGQLVLIANGEIYNHKELAQALPSGTRMRTGSDCEVLLHLYREHGLDFLRDVRGMFGLILWDKADGRLVLARDRFGVKPLFFHASGHRIVVASEIKALFEAPGCPREVDWTGALSDQSFTSEPYVTDAPAKSWFVGVESVPPAGLVIADLRSGRLHRRSWQSPGGEAAAPSSYDMDTVYDEYFSLLDSAVTETLMADVEIGLFLSGGIDSATVAALAARQGEVHCFTAATAGTVLNGDVEFARRTAAHVGAPHHVVAFPAERHPTLPEWRDLLWLTETPLCSPEQFYKFELHRFARQRRPGVKAMLLGAAADEYTGGYSKLLSGDGGWRGFTGALAQLNLAGRLAGRPALASWWREGQPLLLRPELLEDSGDPRDDYQRFVDLKMRDVNQYNCWHEDRTAGGNGIEARVPFLDPRLVDFVRGIPPEQREALLWDKHLLREAVRRRGILPPEVTGRQKEPFYDGRVAKHTHRTFLAMLSDDFLDAALSSRGAKSYVDVDGVHAARAALVDGRGDGHVEILLRVLNLGLLDGMLGDLPAPLPVHPQGVVLRALPTTDETALRDAAQEVLWRDPTWQDEVPRLKDDVLMVSSLERDQFFVVKGGRLSFVLEADADRRMVDLLTRVDGRTDVTALAAAVGVTAEDVRLMLRQALESGVVDPARPVDQAGRP